MMRLYVGVIAATLGAVLTTIALGAGPTAQDGGEFELELMIGRSHMVNSKQRIEQVIVVDPSIADAEVVGPRRIVFFGRKLGATDVILQFENDASARYELAVTIDSGSLQKRLDSIFGRGLVVDLDDGVLVLSGTLGNLQEVLRLEEFMKARGYPYVDMTELPGVQQVLLRVRIAEVSRDALRELAFAAVAGGGSVFGGFQPGADGSPFNPVGIQPAPGGAIAPTNYVYQSGANTVSSAATLFGGIPAADLALYIKALKQNKYVRILAEPNLVAISGEEASFLVGGEFPIPVVQGTTVGGGSSVTVEYKEVGIRLGFRPEVLGENRIRLSVSPEVSELSHDFGGVQVSGFSIPGVLVRRSKTTVELFSGQTFAIAGLLKTHTSARSASIPLLGELPIIGSLFRSVRYLESKTELVVLVTAELVEPISTGGSEMLPGSLHVRPDDWQLFMDGRIADTVIAPLPPSQEQALRKLGLDKLKGPGAWRRFDDPPTPARPDAMPQMPERDDASSGETSGKDDDEGSSSPGVEQPS